MQKDINLPMIAVINDLDALIVEIDENPQLSSWVVRLVLKSIKDKARQLATAPVPQPAYLNAPGANDSFEKASAIANPKTQTLRRVLQA